jgi:hypothetical protein
VTDLVLHLPGDVIEHVAQRSAEIVLASIPAAGPPSPFMTPKEAATYLRCQRQSAAADTDQRGRPDARFAVRS